MNMRNTWTMAMLALAPLGAWADAVVVAKPAPVEARPARVGKKEGANGGGSTVSQPLSAPQAQPVRRTCKPFIAGIDDTYRKWSIGFERGCHADARSYYALLLDTYRPRHAGLKFVPESLEGIDQESREALEDAVMYTLADGLRDERVSSLFVAILEELSRGKEPEALKAQLASSWLRILTCEPGQAELEAVPGYRISVTHLCGARYAPGSYAISLSRDGAGAPALSFSAEEAPEAGMASTARRYLLKGLAKEEGAEVYRKVVELIEEGKLEKARKEWIKRSAKFDRYL
jgi:hypothetical protein